MALKFPDKGPDEILDYPVDFGDLLPDGRGLSAVTAPVVTIERPSNSESPILLGFPSPGGVNVSASLSESPLLSPARLDTVSCWLSGGSLGTTYTVRFEVLDNLAAPRPRKFVRRVKIKIKEKVD